MSVAEVPSGATERELGAPVHDRWLETWPRIPVFAPPAQPSRCPAETGQPGIPIGTTFAAFGSVFHRSSARLPTLALGLALAPTAVAIGQDVHERTAVRAGELLVAIESRTGPLRLASPVRFSPRNFEVTLGGEPVTVLSIDESIEVSAGQPWEILVYVDAALSSNDLVRSATGLLAGAAAELAALGTVEIVVADPDPGRLLAPTRDTSRISETLAGLSLGEVGDDLLVVQRRELSDLVDVSDGPDDLFGLAVAREAEIVRRQSDGLLTWLANEERESPRRVLLLISGGFDLAPEAFYEALFAVKSSNGEAAGAARQTEAATRDGAGREAPAFPTASPARPESSRHREVARAIAAAGWISFSLGLPEPDPLPRRWGLRRALVVWLDGNWDPERAEALFELGESLIAQKKWKAAERALRDASYHYYSQPKLRPRQARALLRLAFVLEQQDRPVEAEKVARKAVLLDPTLASEIELVGLLDPVAPLALLAEVTSGGRISDRQGLDDAIVGLSRRLRLGYQAAGRAPEEPLPVTVDYDVAGHEALSVAWAPGASPSSISRARSRRLLEEDLDVAIATERLLDPASLEVSCSFIGDGGSASRPARLDVIVDPGLGPAWAGVQTRLRATASSWIDDSVATAQSTGEELEWQPGDELRVSVELEATEGDAEIAVVLEELTTSRWLATFAVCEPPVDPAR